MSWYAKSVGKATNVARVVAAQLEAQSQQAGHAQVLQGITDTVNAVAAEAGEAIVVVETQGHIGRNYDGSYGGGAKLDIQILGWLAPDPEPASSDATGVVEG